MAEGECSCRLTRVKYVPNLTHSIKGCFLLIFSKKIVSTWAIYVSWLIVAYMKMMAKDEHPGLVYAQFNSFY